MTKMLVRLFGVTSAVWNFFAPVLKQIVVDGVSDLLPIALDIVRSLADTKISGAQKREMAVSRLRDAALDHGVEAAESLLRWTIESAVQRMRADAQDEGTKGPKD